MGPDALPEERGGGSCHYLGVKVLCGPRGLPGAPDAFFRNRGFGRFEEQSEASGAIDRERYFGLGVVAGDLDGDGDADVYVGNDATPNLLFVNRGDGRFDERGFASGLAVSGDGNEQASMGVDAADYDNDGRLDVYSTHFANDYSTLYRNLGGMEFEDVTARARIRDTSLGELGHPLRRPRPRRLEGHRQGQRARLPAPARGRGRRDLRGAGAHGLPQQS